MLNGVLKRLHAKPWLFFIAHTVCVSVNKAFPLHRHVVEVRQGV